MKDCDGKPQVVILATGSEVWVALEACDMLKDIKVRVVNIACWELFDEQNDKYRQDVLGPDSALRVSVEAGITIGWEHYTGCDGLNLGINTFGESAPGEKVAEHFGMTPKCVSKAIQNRLGL